MLNLCTNTLLYCTVLYCTVLYCTVLYGTVRYCTVLYGTVLYCTVLNCTLLNCTARNCTVLYCTWLHCDLWLTKLQLELGLVLYLVTLRFVVVTNIQGISEKCAGASKFWCCVIFSSIYLSKSCRKSGLISLSIHRILTKKILCFYFITNMSMYIYLKYFWVIFISILLNVHNDPCFEDKSSLGFVVVTNLKLQLELGLVLYLVTLWFVVVTNITAARAGTGNVPGYTGICSGD